LNTDLESRADGKELKTVRHASLPSTNYAHPREVEACGGSSQKVVKKEEPKNKPGMPCSKTGIKPLSTEPYKPMLR
jgi:hypothetical protein